MRRSTTLPQFRPSPVDALEAAVAAEREGMDGVFVYDHLWPLRRRPGAPAAECVTLLSAIAAATSRLRVGTLVLRVGLRPFEVAMASLRTVATIAPGRVVAGLGTGDSLNAEENRRFGIPFRPARERIAELTRTARALMDEGVEVWVGGTSRAIREACAEVGATWNCWGKSDAELAAMLAEVPQAHVTWGGDEPPPTFSVLVEEVVYAPSWSSSPRPS